MEFVVWLTFMVSLFTCVVSIISYRLPFVSSEKLIRGSGESSLKKFNVRNCLECGCKFKLLSTKNGYPVEIFCPVCMSNKNSNWEKSE
jgi:hypothetical protein